MTLRAGSWMGAGVLLGSLALVGCTEATADHRNESVTVSPSAAPDAPPPAWSRLHAEIPANPADDKVFDYQ